MIDLDVRGSLPVAFGPKTSGWRDEMASYQALAVQVLQEAREPLTLDEILKRVNARQPVTSANPKHTIRDALSNLQIAGSLGDGRYVYVPRALTRSSPDLTPALRRVFADRLRYLQETSVFSPAGLWERLREEEKALLEEGAIGGGLEEAPARPHAPAVYLYRLRVRLEWQPSVWRIIEVLDNQTLDDLHEAIQDAFGNATLHCPLTGVPRADIIRSS
jgi:hypothetical protein